jgi:peptide/nickel transport system permease protein
MFSRTSAAWIIGRAIVILMISGLAGATLVRMAPGFGLDEQARDTRLSVESRKAFEKRHSEERDPVAFYLHFLRGLLGGDAGESTVFEQPVNHLIRERAPVTIGLVSAGFAMGWGAAIVMGIGAVLKKGGLTLLPALALSGSVISIPSAVLATFCLLLQLPPSTAIAAVVFPRVFPHVYEQLRAGLLSPHVIMARGRGLYGARLFLFHALPPALMPLLALAGTSATLAFGASIPIEALADAPGIGQLAWRAALGRDLPVLVTVTLLLTAVTVFFNVIADFVTVRLEHRAA